MRNEAGSEAVPEIQQIAAHHQTDLGAQLRIWRHWTATASLTNITANRSVASFRPFGARPTAPFQAMIGLRAEL